MPSPHSRQRRSSSRLARERSLSTASSVTLAGNGFDNPIELDPGAIFTGEIIDLTGEHTQTLNILRSGEDRLNQVRVKGQVFRAGDVVEVSNCSLGLHPVEFLQIKIVVGHQNGDVILRGIPFSRTRNMLGKLPKKSNEVCKLLHFKQCSQERLEDAPLFFDVYHHDAIRKRHLIFTNAIYPDNSSNEIAMPSTGTMGRSRRRNEECGLLICRWALKVISISHGRRSKPEEEVLERLPSADVPDPRYKLSEETLCNRWRGGRTRGGSWDDTQTPYACPSAIVDLENDASELSASSCRASRKYTLFDAFSGAGGVSRGAQIVGLKVLYAVDKSPDVWETYQENFPETLLYEMSVDQFIQSTQEERIRVDVLHLSPPCQYFSPAHTQQSVHDDDNIFALFGCNELINKTRPRIITVEQTFGITHDKHHQYLRCLIGDFTQFGYSVRWKVVRLCTWGSAQDRKRLVVIAAAPGEALPPFPEPTHSERGGGGLQPFTTVRQAIRGIRNTDSLHDLHHIRHFNPPRPRIPNDRLAGTITTGSGDFYHPDGHRELSLREYACLQGFPRHHYFAGNKTSIRRQIGNAFPPNTVAVLYQHIQDWLLKQDGFEPRQSSRENGIFSDNENDWSVDRAAMPIGECPRPAVDNTMEIDEDIVDLTRDDFVECREVIDLTV
ncbi:DNA (cytosine-5-)-methyltransferase [Purpureocillium takamizusanense]|uniref:DNA (cytosine-5-)-methyltransferase n=1 Tax=Purpureocillium takamizusanense TaxID=2060973 RepID=A0A9Q8VG74_9HYPO|nr:DNA (cytosine-5-)-methyltransferase [Purpureocillium takamizusanense]UNI24348.1 DNA (cytosine-5-)-methyltransferase [Purpureocillium takamizusanense]